MKKSILKFILVVSSSTACISFLYLIYPLLVDAFYDVFIWPWNDADADILPHMKKIGRIMNVVIISTLLTFVSAYFYEKYKLK